MSEEYTPEIIGEYHLLFRVPKPALIRDLLLTRQERELQEALAPVVKIDPPISQTHLAQLSHTKLIHVVQRCASISLAQVRELHDQYRYSGMKTLYLYEVEPTAHIKITGELLDQLNQLFGEIRQNLGIHIANFINPTFRDWDSIKTTTVQVEELSYSYIAALQYTDPATEFPALVDDLRKGFVWISIDHDWLAICARDQNVNYLIVKTLERQFSFQIHRLPLPKPVLQQLWPLNRIRRLSLIDQRTNTKRRWTNPDMSRDDKAMGEIQTHDAEDERTACGYNEQLPDGEQFALGFSNSQSRIFFSRDLTVTQLRTWGPDKITELVETVRAYRAANPVVFLSTLSEQVFTGRGIRNDVHATISEIAQAILTCKRNGGIEAKLSFDTLSVLLKIRSYIIPHYLVDCPECQEYTNVVCAHCHNVNFQVREQNIFCLRCGNPIDLHEVTCSEGHTTDVVRATDLVTLTPQENMMLLLRDLIQLASDQNFDINKEFFQIRGDSLHYTTPGGKIIYSINEIPEVSALLQGGATQTDLDAITSQLRDFKEKCDYMSNDACASCVSNRHDGPCYLRLFGLFDPEFTPKPHQGDEYGDYSKTVTIEGSEQRMVIAMKSSAPSNRSITMRDQKGQDIYTQVRIYMDDPTIDVIGISIPRRLEDRFKVRMQMDADRLHKKLVFIDHTNLAQIVYSTMIKNKLVINQI